LDTFKVGGYDLSDNAIEESAKKRYLLGKSSDDEKTLLEEGFFADDSEFEALEIAEDELVDGFVRNKLSPEDRRQFTARLIKSDRLNERVNFARVLVERADSLVAPEQDVCAAPEPSVDSSSAHSGRRWWEGLFAQPAWRTALAASVVLITLASGILISRWWQVTRESERVAAERALLQRQKEELDKQALEQQAKNEQITAEMKRDQERLAEKLSALEEADKQITPTPQQPVGFASVFLSPGSLRSGGDRSELKVRPDTTTAKLFIELERNDYPSYSVTIRAVDNDQVVFSKKGIKPRTTGAGQVLVVLVPANRLPPSDYNVSVDGVTASGGLESVEDYAFRASSR
jgi:hypothetical protein